MTSALQSKRWVPAAAAVVANSALEIDWVRVRGRSRIYRGALPPAETDLQSGNAVGIRRGVCGGDYPRLPAGRHRDRRRR